MTSPWFELAQVIIASITYVGDVDMHTEHLTSTPFVDARWMFALRNANNSTMLINALTTATAKVPKSTTNMAILLFHLCVSKLRVCWDLLGDLNMLKWPKNTQKLYSNFDFLLGMDIFLLGLFYLANLQLLLIFRSISTKYSLFFHLESIFFTRYFFTQQNELNFFVQFLIKRKSKLKFYQDQLFFYLIKPIIFVKN